MKDQDVQEKAINAVTILIKSVTALRLYPPTSAIVNQTIDLLLQACTELLEEKDPLILAEAERKLLVDGEPADHKDQEKYRSAPSSKSSPSWISGASPSSRVWKKKNSLP